MFRVSACTSSSNHKHYSKTTCRCNLFGIILSLHLKNILKRNDYRKMHLKFTQHKTIVMKTAILSLIFLCSALFLMADPSNPDTGATLQGSIHAQLQGRWENVISSSELPDTAREENAGPESVTATATLYYHFRSNGAFVLSIDNGAIHVEESGRWEISDDGQYLLLYFQGKEVEKAAIKYVELDEMVLEHSIRLPGTSYRTETRQYFFNKV